MTKQEYGLSEKDEYTNVCRVRNEPMFLWNKTTGKYQLNYKPVHFLHVSSQLKEHKSIGYFVPFPWGHILQFQMFAVKCIGIYRQGSLTVTWQ